MPMPTRKWWGVYSLKPGSVEFVYDNTFNDKTEKWLKDWGEKIDERELVAVASGTKGTRGNTFI